MIALALAACTKNNDTQVPVSKPGDDTEAVYVPEKTGDVYVDVWVNYSLRPTTIPDTYDYFAQLSEPVPFKVEVVANTGVSFVVDAGKTMSEKKPWPDEFGVPSAENCFSLTVNPAYEESGEVNYYFQCDR